MLLYLPLACSFSPSARAHLRKRRTACESPLNGLRVPCECLANLCMICNTFTAILCPLRHSRMIVIFRDQHRTRLESGSSCSREMCALFTLPRRKRALPKRRSNSRSWPKPARRFMNRPNTFFRRKACGLWLALAHRRLPASRNLLGSTTKNRQEWLAILSPLEHELDLQISSWIFN